MTKKSKKMALKDIIIRYDLYPRLPMSNADSSQSNRAIESYKLSIEDLPPIVVNQDNILIDGWHRWEAYKLLLEDIQDGMVEEDIELSKRFDPNQIEVIVIKTDSEEQVLFEATKANSLGNVVMTREEKRDVALRLMDKFTDNEIAAALQVPRSTVNYWTKVKRDEIIRLQKELLFEYMDKYPDLKDVDIRRKILEEHGVEISHSSHHDWKKAREKIEASWSEEETVAIEAPLGGADTDMSYAEYLRDKSESGVLSEPDARPVVSAKDTLTPDAPITEYVCDGYDVKQKGVSLKEYLQSGCLKCKNLRTTGLVGWEITNSCTKGHQMVQTGLRRDR
jgi:hypothetical protein